ncbi:MAG: hypothetical protein LDL16_09610 [Thiobacillus sp.]|nr:hypothetical protein [Thiobacillus sp.]
MKLDLPDCLQHRLVREIALAIVIKLVVIVGLYYAFFAGHGVAVDPDTLADRISNPQQSQTTDPRSAHVD